MMSSMTFGMIPLFTKPAQDADIGTFSIIVYRFIFASIAMYIIMLFKRCNLRITGMELLKIIGLAVLNLVSAITLFYGYYHLSSGAATTIQFSYPVFTCLIMVIFYGEKISWKTILAIVLAVGGVALLAGVDTGEVSVLGVTLELVSGFTYALYIVAVDKLGLNDMEPYKLTFYVFLLSALLMIPFTALTTGIEVITSPLIIGSILMLGIIPTAVSNFTLLIGVRYVGSTMTAILGALEPLTAIIIGIIIFSEPFTLINGLGAVAIIISVLLLIKKDKTEEVRLTE